MKDLDIRGAGDLLGAEQSGFINDIGFETYHKILEEAVRELKDEHFKELFADAQSLSGSGGSSALARGSRRDQSDDCIIETDLTMLIPNSNERDRRTPRALPQARRHQGRGRASASPTRSPTASGRYHTR
ncbi:MAG: hypothetical protein R2811_06270 [Flavobacteriales bacterium]